MHIFGKVRSSAPLTALVAVLVTLLVSGGAYATASTLITGKQVKNHSLTGRDVKKRSLTGRHIKRRSLTGGNIKKHTVGAKVLKKGVLRKGRDGKDGAAGQQGAAGPQGATGARCASIRARLSSW